LATEEGALIGPPEEIIARLQRMRDGGIEYVLLIDITGSRDSLRTFRDEVMPALA
jgi:alkanesulfonate monooxygenase SsuD/methylene tetrahydromethanopterin reductase-like flavin-dependent oxidoreductase (luciferase family)